MKKFKNMRLENFILSFQEIWKYDKRLLFILLADIIINALSPFPNIILAGLIVDSIAKGEDFPLVIFYVALLFGINFLLTSVNTILSKAREYLFIKFFNKLNNDINNKCMNIDFELFNESSFQDRILLVSQMAYGNNFLPTGKLILTFTLVIFRYLKIIATSALIIKKTTLLKINRMSFF